MKKNTRSVWIIATLAVLYFIGYIYFLNPTMNLRFKEGIAMLIPLCIGLYIWEIKKVGRLEKIRFRLFSFLFSLPFIFIGLGIAMNFPGILLIPLLVDYIKEKKKKNRPENRVRFSRYIFLGIITYLLIIPFLTSSPLLQSSKYRDLIGEVKIAEDFSELYPPVSASSIRVVDQSMALRLGEKVLGQDPSIGSQSELGTFRIQSVNGQLYWVAPLIHSGFFKWQENRQGTRGYVMVSATDDSDVQLVQQTAGNEVLIKYQPGSYLGENLKRYIYFHGYMGRGYSDYTFEIDDEGRPYWVVTLYQKRVGFQGKDATGILLVDCRTGLLKEYGIADAPQWVDRIQPESFIVSQLDHWGELVHGAMNFSDKDKLTTTPGLSLVYGKEGRSYWYTGLTSVGSDEGTVGFVLVDTRSKEAFWYKQAGATERAARKSAEGKVQEKRYSATQPVMYNIAGISTYIMSLTDDAGLVKMYAAVPVEDYTAVEVAETLDEVLYLIKGEEANAPVPMEIEAAQSSSWEILEGTVLRIASEVKQGNTVYYLIIPEAGGSIFYGPSRISPELPLTQAGDRVKIQFPSEASGVVEIRSFDNFELLSE